jgi:hypothetical protein
MGAALREHNLSQVGSAGTSPLADVLRSLLAPRTADAAPDQAHVEPDAFHQLLARF